MSYREYPLNSSHWSVTIPVDDNIYQTLNVPLKCPEVDIVYPNSNVGHRHVRATSTTVTSPALLSDFIICRILEPHLQSKHFRHVIFFSNKIFPGKQTGKALEFY